MSGLVYPITFWGRWSTRSDFTSIPSHLVLSSAALAELAKSALSTPYYWRPTSSSVYLNCFFLALCPVELSLLSQKTLRHGYTILVPVSWSTSGVRHIFQWLLGSFCKDPHCWYGPCMRCSITFGSIFSKRTVSFSLALPSRSMTHMHTEIWRWQGSASVLPLIEEICLYLSKLALALLELQWLVQSLREPPLLSLQLNNCSKVLEVCHCSKASVLKPRSPSGFHWRCFLLFFVFSALISILYLGLVETVH